MNKVRALFVSMCLGVAPAWPQGVITTFAGNGTGGYSGDGGPATIAMINRVVGIATDAAGNVYLADENNHRVRKVDRNGIMTTLAGTGVAGFSGDGGPAQMAQVNQPLGVCVDSASNVYVNENGNKRVRRISPNGVITTVAGSGSATHSGDGGPATSAGFVIPIRCATDRNGNLYIVDQGAHRVRKVDPSGTISTYAGTGTIGFSGDGGPAVSAALNNPTALATDASGNLYITDQSNHRIRRVNTSGVIQTVAGTGNPAFGGDGGPATSGSFAFPGSVAVDSAGNLFIVDTNALRIRQVSGGNITTIAGTGATGFGGDNGPPLQAMFNSPFAIAIDGSGNIYIGDTFNNRIRKIAGVAAGGPSGAAPTITSAGVTNGASFQTGIVPGGIITIFGSNLGASPGQIVAQTGSSWTNQVGGVSATMDGAPVPVYRVLNLNGQEQLSVQAPFSLSGKNSTSVVVTTPNGASAPVAVPVLGAQPGVFILDSNNDGAVHADGTIVTSSSAATRGETVVLYLTGLGSVANPPQAGQPASLTSLSPTLLTPEVVIGGFNASVAFAGLTPGYIGLYQVNVVVPNAVSAGTVDVTVRSNNISSNISKLPVQ